MIYTVRQIHAIRRLKPEITITDYAGTFAYMRDEAMKKLCRDLSREAFTNHNARLDERDMEIIVTGRNDKQRTETWAAKWVPKSTRAEVIWGGATKPFVTDHADAPGALHISIIERDETVASLYSVEHTPDTRRWAAFNATGWNEKTRAWVYEETL